MSRGNIKPPRNPTTCIVELNDLMARLDLPLTRQILLERVALGISGIRPLTREGNEAEREAFTGLVRELVDEDGLSGGSGLCDAIVGRARMTMKTGENDLTFEQAMDHLMDLMPNRAVRLGFLLDLVASPGGRKEKPRVLEALDRVAVQITLPASLIPNTSSLETAARVIGKLKGRLKNEHLPEDRRQNLTTILDGLATKKSGGGKAGSKGATNKYGMKDGSLNKNDQTGERKSVIGGELIFEEGDTGDMAYLIISGEVDIFRKSGAGVGGSRPRRDHRRDVPDRQCAPHGVRASHVGMPVQYYHPRLPATEAGQARGERPCPETPDYGSCQPHPRTGQKSRIGNL